LTPQWNTHVILFFKANGFETKDINSKTNKTLGISSPYSSQKKIPKTGAEIIAQKTTTDADFSIHCAKITAFGSMEGLKLVKIGFYTEGGYFKKNQAQN
jgi:maleate cis-trans isomerase